MYQKPEGKTQCSKLTASKIDDVFFWFGRSPAQMRSTEFLRLWAGKLKYLQKANDHCRTYRSGINNPKIPEKRRERGEPDKVKK